MFELVDRDAGHRDGAVALGQREAEDARAEFGVVLEQLVEVAVAEQDEHPGVLGLRVPVLLHHAGHRLRPVEGRSKVEVVKVVSAARAATRVYRNVGSGMRKSQYESVELLTRRTAQRSRPYEVAPASRRTP